MNFDDFLSRADEQILQDLLGKTGIRLITLMDPALSSPTKLREVVVGLYTREGLLLSPTSRALLLDLLPSKMAEILAQSLDLSYNTDPYSALKELKIIRGSEREKILFNFFELYPPPVEEQKNTPESEIISVGYALFPHQRKAALSIRKELSQEPRRVVLHMPTGSGKTRTAMNIIADHLRAKENALVIWLAYSEELCEQAAEEFEKAWRAIGNRDICLYRFWGDRELDPQNIRDGLIISGLAKMYNKAKTNIGFISTLGNRCSLVIIDEAHQAIAETYSLVLDALVMQHATTGLLGLTATPGRTWADIDADKKLSDFFAGRKVTLQVPGYDSPITYLISENYLAKTEFKCLLFKTGLTLTETDLQRLRSELEIPQYILKKLAEDEQRNLAIILRVEELAKRHRRILVFASTVEHSKLLATVLRARGFIADSVTGDISALERARIISNFKMDDESTRIVCNYGVLTTGFDAPKTSAAVIARPTKSLVLYSQMVGRAIRGIKAGGNKTAEVLTVVDNALPGFRNIAEAFNNWEDVWK